MSIFYPFLSDKYINVSSLNHAMPEFLCQQEVEMRGRKYTVYLKEVPTKLGREGMVEATTVRAFVREAK